MPETSASTPPAAAGVPRVPWYLSISMRMLTAMALLVALIVGAVLWLWATSAEKLIRDQAREEGAAVTQTLALALTPFVSDENWNQARIVADFLVQRNADFVYVIVSDARDPRIALSVPADQEGRYLSDLVPTHVSKQALVEGDTRFAETFLLRDVAIGGRTAKRGERIIDVAKDLKLSTQRFGVVRVGVSLRRADQTLATTIRAALVAVAACLAVALVAAYFVTRSITRPIIELARSMEAVGAGDLEQEVKVKGRHEVARLGRSFNEMLMGLRHKRVLEKYVPMGARKDIAGDRAGKLELGGRRRRAAILFSDLRGFTSLSERLSPQEVVSMLNEYLEIMTRAIAAHHGDINEYVGDAILAVFRCDDGHRGALAAVRAAWEMQRGLRELQARTKNDEVRKLAMGIGVHVGDVIEGNIGSQTRVKYGVVGDTVNLAARIQDRSREGTFSCIFVSDAAHEELGESFAAVSLGEMTFKGKKNPMGVWEIERRLEPETTPTERKATIRPASIPDL